MIVLMLLLLVVLIMMMMMLLLMAVVIMRCRCLLPAANPRGTTFANDCSVGDDPHSGGSFDDGYALLFRSNIGRGE
uniref:Putative secreted protein n=1 Tax=Panstrongylus lignarius TaxID=156445 RepID=A0A224XTI4_9HEMI